MSTMKDKRAASSRTDEPRVAVVREGPPLDSERVDDILSSLESGFSGDPAAPSVAVVLGEGAQVRVRSGHLQIFDGLGPYRRHRRWPRAGSGLRRVIVGADSGALTIDALRWCQAVGVSILVVDGDGEVVLGPAAYGHDDPRLRRAQATASEEVAVAVASGLIVPKILGQASVAETRLGDRELGDMLREIRASIEEAVTIDEIRGLEATAAASYFDAWVGHPAVIPRFSSADQRRIPSHWMHYDGRRSLLGKGNVNRKAERPTNVLLNVLYRLAAIEARLACLAVGLEPAFGALHLDAINRDSFVLDLMEPVRPEVDRFVIDLMAEITFTRKDFIERSDGSIRIGPELCQRLSATMPVWARSVAPYAEQVAHIYGHLVAGKWAPRTPLTGRNARSAAAVVKARKQQAVVKGRRSAVARSAAPKREGSNAARTFASCVDCGGRLQKARNLRCQACWDKQPGQSEDVRQRRGLAIAQARSAQEQWRRENPYAAVDPDVFRNKILPGLAAVPLREIMAVTGSSKSSASSYRSGRSIPHPMHWAALAAFLNLRSQSPCE
jgi:CRISPR-associated endonuclease Cas1